jgi:hypothetical protein
MFNTEKRNRSKSLPVFLRAKSLFRADKSVLPLFLNPAHLKKADTNLTEKSENYMKKRMG